MWVYVRIFLIVIIIGGLPIWVGILGSLYRWYDYIATSVSGVPAHNAQFDFIVVGAGSAGAVVAARLSRHHKVLLLEAGDSPIPFHNVPGLAFELLNHASSDWMYKSVEQKEAAFGFINRSISYPRGKSLGGSSNLNYMFYLRGNKKDYDNWANLVHDDAWKYDNMLPYFKKSLVYNGKFSGDLKHYGKAPYGNLHVEKRIYAPLRDQFISAGKELGYDEIDVNANQRTGFGDVEATVKDGARWGVYRAFLQGLANPNNLVISRYSHARKISIVNGQAVGVWYDHHNQRKYARARKEIIVSCGTIDSPKLLKLSGIGPKDELKRHGIKVKVTNEHVGKNLQDHPAVALMPITIERPLTLMPFRDFTLDAVMTYLSNGSGVFSNPSAVGAQAFISSSFVKKQGIDWPDLQLYVFAAGLYETVIEDLVRVWKYNETVLRPMLEPFVVKDAFIVLVTLVRPEARGIVELRDKDPYSPALIDPKFLENKKDVAVLIEGMKLAERLVETTEAFKAIGAKFQYAPFPGCKQHPWKSEAFWECFIRHFTFSLYHPTSTCSMGKVVDSKLRVKGVKGLRVADASIMPVIVNANTNAPTIAIGERAADFIREYWASQYEVCPLHQSLLLDLKNQCFYSQMT